MRRFLTTTASATFFGESKYTARIMKDHLEYIVRNQPGMYAVVLVIPAAKDVVRVVCNWGDYFEKAVAAACESFGGAGPHRFQVPVGTGTPPRRWCACSGISWNTFTTIPEHLTAATDMIQGGNVLNVLSGHLLRIQLLSLS